MPELVLIESYETFDYDRDAADESLKKSAPLVLKGTLQKANTLNQNGRVYPLDILEREVRNYQKFITERRAMGELDHPDSSVVNLKNVSHIVTEARVEDGVVKGSIEVLDRTPSGAILRGLVESRVKIGISSRGVGSLKKQGDHYVVQNDFQLICWDTVSEPSTPGAFMIPEGRVIDARELRKIFKRSDRIDRILNDILYGG